MLVPGDVNDEIWRNSHIRVGGERVGHVCTEYDPEARTGVVRDIVVEPQYRGRGVGSEALRRVEADAGRRGARELSVELSDVDTGGTEEGRERLARFWERGGYEIDQHDDTASPGIFATGRKRL